MLEFIKENIALSIVLLCLGLALIAFFVWVLWSNKAIQLNRVPVKSNGSLKIIHISDYHNAKFKNNNEELLSLIKATEPDIIAITGDFIDSRHTNVARSIRFATELVKIAPCYYAPGNHESRMPENYAILTEALDNLGVTILSDQKTTLEK
ncbi:MAG: metallophosphoesterase, partial [Clostridia bacterium]|nr:metallophosphoesterase [Clostridia bacterium]